jgi:hypothetical protein
MEYPAYVRDDERAGVSQLKTFTASMIRRGRTASGRVRAWAGGRGRTGVAGAIAQPCRTLGTPWRKAVVLGAGGVPATNQAREIKVSRA